MSFLSFNWDKHFIYAIIYWILEIFVRLFMYIRWHYFKMSKSDVQNEYIYVILLNIADLLSGFLVLYTFCAFRNTNKTKIFNIGKTNTTGSVQLIYENKEDYRSKYFFLKLLLICVLDYLSRSLYWISYAITGATNENVSHQLQKDVVNTFDILMRYIFSILILKSVIHKHRVLSIIIIIFGFLLLLPADFLLITGEPEIDMGKTLSYVGILAFRALLFPLSDTICKQLFADNYILPQNLMFSKALMEMIIIIILTPTLFFSFGLKWEIYFEVENIVTIIIYTLAASVKAYFLLKIIYHFSSQSVSFLVISESVTGSINEIIYFIKDPEKEATDIILLILELIGILIIAFATLLYDEVIIIKKWNLDQNVKSGIISRAELDTKKTKEIELARDSTFEENMASPTSSPGNDIKENLNSKEDDD